MVFQIICAWCGRSMGTKECAYSNANNIKDPITHSICLECAAKAKADIESIQIEKCKNNRNQ